MSSHAAELRRIEAEKLLSLGDAEALLAAAAHIERIERDLDRARDRAARWALLIGDLVQMTQEQKS